MEMHVWMLLSVVIATAVADFTSNCPQECRCLWENGLKLASCLHSHLQYIPQNFSSEIQYLDLTGNDLYEVKRYEFLDANIINLKKLVLKECKLITIQRNGLSGLAMMTELHLSNNKLKMLHLDTFRETTKIRWILLNDNQLEKLEDGLFNNLPFLEKVDLSNNKILTVGMKTFMNVPKMTILRLNGNKLENLKIDTLRSLTSLSNLDVQDNPWRCDCFLQTFRDWVISKNFYSSPILSCVEPPKVHGKLWILLDSSDFACKPSILYPPVSTTLRTSDYDVTLSCQVIGDPLPEVNWVLNGQKIDGAYRYQGELKYNITQKNLDNSKWVNLTIVDLGNTDNGEYLCVAKNPGGVAISSVTLTLAPHRLNLFIFVSCTAAVLVIILVILCFCYYRRRGSDKKKSDNPNGEALIEGSVIPEKEKSLITAVDPGTNLPRTYDVRPSLTSGAKEMQCFVQKLNESLLHHDSVLAYKNGEKRTPDVDPPSKQSQEPLHVGYDLISFPPRPVTAPITPADVTPSQGCVTMPREPGVPTASTEILPSSEAQETLYEIEHLYETIDCK